MRNCNPLDQALSGPHVSVSRLHKFLGINLLTEERMYSSLLKINNLFLKKIIKVEIGCQALFLNFALMFHLHLKFLAKSMSSFSSKKM